MWIRRLEKILEPFFQKIGAKNIKYAQIQAKIALENARLFTQIHQKTEVKLTPKFFSVFEL